MKNSKKLLYLLPSLIWMIIIFLFSQEPADLSNKNNLFIANILKKLNMGLFTTMNYDFLNLLIRKVAHVSEYFILFMLLYFGLKKISYKNPKVFGGITTFLYACTDEFHQIFIPGRVGCIKDVFIDSMGIFIGLIVIYIYSFLKECNLVKK